MCVDLAIYLLWPFIFAFNLFVAAILIPTDGKMGKCSFGENIKTTSNGHLVFLHPLYQHSSFYVVLEIVELLVAISSHTHHNRTISVWIQRKLFVFKGDFWLNFIAIYRRSALCPFFYCQLTLHYRCDLTGNHLKYFPQKFPLCKFSLVVLWGGSWVLLFFLLFFVFQGKVLQSLPRLFKLI